MNSPLINNMQNVKGMYKQIEGYSNYWVSTEGEVISLRNPNSPKILKPQMLESGYMQVRLYKNNVGKTKTVHRLVCSAFLPNFYQKKTVNHKDKDRTNNKLWNLEWATQKEQCVDLKSVKYSHLRSTRRDFVGEIWKPVEEFPTYYVSNMGRLKKDGSELRRYGTWRGSRKTPCWSFTFKVGNKTHSRRAHNVVAQYFVPNPNNYKFVKFIDNNKRNTCATNLRWSVTHK
jgi:hypothetical protein